uniref:Uncharacterized protein n=1 Tax=Oryza glumipatula TaxID=40148 RepID=A0A0E0A8J4_9ORYZ
MAELATGAVSSLLGVIRNEALLLHGVRDDVQFIKEEMESMRSFLANLGRWAPPGGEHDEQVRTWMNQVRLLAQDCNNCIDLYLYRGNPDIHRARGGLRRYIWWVSWSLHKMAAQHRAAFQLRQLKDRARDVGERRLRYGVEIPAAKAAASAAAGDDIYAPEDDEEDHEDELMVVSLHHSGGPRRPRAALCEIGTLDDHVKAKLLEWFDGIPPGAGVTFSIAIMAPNTYQEALDLARDTLAVLPTEDRAGYNRDILVNIPAVHPSSLPLRTKDVLYYILRRLKYAKPSGSQKKGQDEEDEAEGERYQRDEGEEEDSQKQGIDQYEGGEEEEEEEQSEKHCIDQGEVGEEEDEQAGKDENEEDEVGEQSQKQGIDQDEEEEEVEEEEEEEDLDSWQDYYKKLYIYREKKRELCKIKGNIKRMRIYEKLDKIKSDIQARKEKGKGNQQQLLHSDLIQKKGVDVDKLDLDVLLLLLHESATTDLSQQDQVRNKGMYNLPDWDDNIILKIAKKLKEHMEADENTMELNEQSGGEEKEEIAKQGEEEQEKEGGEKQQQQEEEDDKQNEQMDKGEDIKEEEKDEDEEEEDDDDDDDEDDDDDNDDSNDDYDDVDDDEGPICLHEDQYAEILREVFPKTTDIRPLHAEEQATKTTMPTLDEERVKQMIHEAKQEVLKAMQQGKSDKNQATSEPSTLGQIRKTDFEEIMQKIEKLKQKLKEQLKINRIVDKIKRHLKNDCPLIILKVDEMMDGSRWEEIRKALSLLECSADAVIITNTNSTHEAKDYYYPPREPIDYSLVGLYNDKILEFTSQLKNEDSPNTEIFHDILEEYEPYEFCMKIFTHALYANPKRSNEELINLRETLQDSPKSFNVLAKKMFIYSYNDLPKEYKSCLLYLAIFPKGQKIRRSTLIGRWVTEGLTFKEDWPSSVRQAYQCFDALIHRWLIYPADIGATGKVKSCVVGDLVHGFITTIARKQHFVETRLSHHLARHFSVFNDIQLRSSDRIDKFFQRLSESSRVSLLKVLDLEGCQCFGDGMNQKYLKDICNKMLLLKYLSLRRTDITKLPKEINNLHELEVLDIRQTKVPTDATVNILLLKLKYLLAGHIDSSPSNSDSVYSVQIPHRIDKMVKVEVLSNVKACRSDDLKDIGKLWQLRKLGVVIDDKKSHLKNLLQTVSDLHECLRSLSITFPVATSFKDPPSNVELPANIGYRLRHHPKILRSLRICGTTMMGDLLPVITKGGNNKLTKVTLSSTLLSQGGLNILAKLPVLRCLRLRHIACTKGLITFREDEFICLKYLLIEGSGLTNITFESGSALELEKMVLSSTSPGSIVGADRLPKLEELELKDNFCDMLLSSFDNAEQIAKLTLCGTLLKQDVLQILAKKPNIRHLVLSYKSFDGNQITFRKDEFVWLNRLDVDCSAITKIVFTTGSAPRLEKIVWSSFKPLPNIECLSGIDELPRLKELEFNGDPIPKEVKEATEKHKNRPIVKHDEPETQDQAKEEEQEYDDDATGFSLCWKKQV